MPTKRNLTAEARRELTVQAVIELSAGDDPATITTTDIAKHMQVTQGALFRHFASKDAIWEAVIDWIETRVMQRLETAAAQADGPLAALRAMFLAHADFIVVHPGVPRLLVGQLQHSRPTPARRRVHALLGTYQQRIERLLIQAREAGELREGLDIASAAVQFIGILQGLAIQALMVNDLQRVARQAPGAFEIFCHGIRPPDAARGKAET
ncbi:TetR/AcrR family transcriptional regulator [Billgrantia saliphila]|uniref:TetR/AcrR family transcriptional regulator n=1 Tax=Billgrantia saliphila TaxID=1848458 RepID=UPI000CE4F47B|nr:TetR family transcriptional regulator [Halomonas saliphila]